ncbi:malate:citrate symporter [Candidatus Phytoplasma phoenicium]|uniref:Malate:citrate symporter n=1 Tax=Candidatus Phytoplasma phoenicium TaxID=198422 RepID=A0A2S8NUG8_9MOLU|nr:malate:citrate symporter [Candidatus Phytoplasma phoenicium]
MNKDLKKNKKTKIKILVFSLPILFLISFILILNLYVGYDGKLKSTDQDTMKYFGETGGFGNTWHGLITPLIISMLLAGLLNFIGKKTPILKDIGGASILCILLPSFLLSYKFSDKIEILKLQKSISQNIKFFNGNKGSGFSSFVVSAIIVGSFFDMDLNLLKKSLKKFFPLVLIALMIGFCSVGLLGFFLNPINGIEGAISTNKNTFLNTIFYIFVPLTSGGMTAGIAPLTQIYSSTYKPEVQGFMEHIYPSLLVGGVFSILLAGLSKKLLDGTKYSGKGSLELPNLSVNNNTSNNKQKSSSNEKVPIEYSNIQTGLIIIFTLYSFSSLIYTLLKNIKIISIYVPENIVFLVLISIILKFVNVITKHYINCIHQASKVITTNFVSPLLVILGATLDINKVLVRVGDFKFLFVCCFTVFLVSLFTGLIAKKMGFYFLEASLTAGLCTNSIGGAGNLSILAAADRMELLPFAQIATRLGGAFIVLVASITYPIFYTV